MGKTLIICEKPSAASRIAAALAKRRPKKQELEGVPYYELERDGKKLVVVPALGHLFTLKNVQPMHDYPVYEIDWMPTYEVDRKAERARAFAEAIRKLAKDADEFICACDFDIEGSTIGYNVLRYLCGKDSLGRAKRMKFSTLTADDLRKAYEQLMPHLDFELIDAGIARHVLDWYWGMNLSKAMSASVEAAHQRFAKLSAGRVQTPALKILVERELEIKAFKPEPFWVLSLLLELEGQELVVEHATPRFFDKAEAERALEACEGKPARVAAIQTRQYRRPPPIPFDLGLLQSEAYRCFGYTPMRTQQIAQALYQAALISYPRTSSQKLPPTINYTGIIGRLSEVSKKYKKFAGELLSLPELIPKEGTKTDPAHPCFTADSTIDLSHGNKITVGEIEKFVLTWMQDKEKRSFIGDIGKRVEIISYDERSKRIVKANITKMWKTPCRASNILEISLEDGRKIQATPNHYFYTITVDGFSFVRADQLKVNGWLACKPEFRDAYNRVLFTEKDFLRTYEPDQIDRIRRWGQGERNIPPPAEVKTINKIRELRIFPIRSNSKLAEVFARLLGFIYGDGHINYYPIKGRRKYPISCFVGAKEDLEQIRDDLADFGLIVKRKLIKTKSEGVWVLRIHNSIVNRILITLGAPLGKKSNCAFTFPNWIKASPNLTKAFLSTCFGCEMRTPKSHALNPRDLRTLDIQINKTNKGLYSGLKFYEEIKSALSGFGIRFSKVKIIERKSGVYSISMRLVNSRENLINFFSNIGFSYCKLKEDAAKKALAYLLLRDCLISKRRELRGEAQELRKHGLSYERIAKILRVPTGTIKGWARGKGSKEEHVSLSLPPFKRFDNRCGEESWVRIVGIKQIPSPKYVYDFEVENYHTFFVNGVLVHNCIYPTGEKPDKLTGPHQKLYDLIVRRFFSVFGKPALAESVRVDLDVGGQPFYLRGRRILDPGWLAYYGRYGATEEVTLPPLEEGQTLVVKEVKFDEKETQPPPRYNPASIVKELESRNLGTKATRAPILQNIYERGYIFGQQITTTDLGMEVIATLSKHCPEIIDEKLTAQFEREMEAIQEGKKNKDEIIAKARVELDKILKKFRKHQLAIGKELGEAYRRTKQKQRVLGPCSKCGGQLKVIVSRRTRKRFAGCSNYPKCNNSFPLPQFGFITALDKNCEQCGAPMIQVKRARMRPYRMCLDPKCESKKDWGKKKAKRGKGSG